MLDSYHGVSLMYFKVKKQTQNKKHPKKPTAKPTNQKNPKKHYKESVCFICYEWEYLTPLLMSHNLITRVILPS